MLNSIISFSLKNKLFIVVFYIALTVAGTYTTYNNSIDVLPNLNRPIVVIMTEAHAMTAEDVESLISIPLEQVLNGATGVKRVTSTSRLGLSIIKVEFAWDSDIYLNRQIISEKLLLAKSRLPEDVEPQMAPISSIMGQIQFVGIRSKTGKTSLEDLRFLADYNLKYDLLSIPGISKVIVAGSSEQQVQIIMDSNKLQSFGISVEQVASAIKKSNQNASGSFINLATRAPSITLTGLLTNVQDVENTFIDYYQEKPILIKDIAKVVFAPSEIKLGDVGINGHDGIVLVLMKQPNYDTVKLTKQIEEKLTEKKATLADDIIVNSNLFKQATFIETAIANVTETIRDGSIMVIIILFLFLMNLRTSIITLSAIPVSLAITSLIFYMLDITINTMTLGGIAVAIGALVDDAIVDVENVYRRLNQQRDNTNKNLFKIIFDASCEVRKPILVGTILVCLVYIPLFFLSGMEGKLFSPIGLAYIISISASLLVALTLTPALCFILLPNHLSKHESGDAFFVRFLKKIVSFFISCSLKIPKTTVITFLIISIGLLVYLTKLGTQFLPPFNEGSLQVNLILPPDTSLDISKQYGKRLEKLLLLLDGVENVTRRTGRAEGDEHAENVNTSELVITLKDKMQDTEKLKAEITKVIEANFPGALFSIDQPISHLLSAMISGIKAQVAIKIFGTDMDVLHNFAKEVKKEIEDIEGVQGLMIEPQILIPNITITPKREQLALHGLSVEDVSSLVEHSLGNEEVTKFIQQKYTYPVILSLQKNQRNNLDKIKNLIIYKADKTPLRLQDVALVETNASYSQIKHENLQRRIVIKHNILGKSLGKVVEKVEQRLQPLKEKIAAKKGYNLKIDGQLEAQKKASFTILIFSIISFVLIFCTLFMHFKSWNLSLQVLFSIPMAFIGSIIFLIITNQTVSIATLVGFISLAGIASRNGILLIDHYLYLMKHEKIPFSKELILQAGRERMAPVLMTALTSAIALIPIVMHANTSGKEILYPVASVIIGGLISSTILDFIVRPALFYIFSKNIKN